MNISTAIYEVNIFFFSFSTGPPEKVVMALVYAAKRETLAMPNDPIPETTPSDHISSYS